MTTYASIDDVLERVWGVTEFSDCEQAPEVNAVGIFGNTPLKVAITWGDEEAVRLLVEGGAEINLTLERGATPLHHAISMTEFAIARYLLSRGANPDARDADGKLPRELCWEGEWGSIFGDSNA